MEYPRDIWHNNVRLKLVGVHPETGIAFYVNDGIGGVIGVQVSPDGRRLQMNATPCTNENSKWNGYRKQHYLQFKNAFGHNKAILAAHAVHIAWIGPIQPGMTIDHIDGCTTNNDFRNLRQIDLRTNMRDGGFLRKLRNKGIDPVTIDRPYLLRYFERMAKLKAEISPYKYYHLTKAQLEQLLYAQDADIHNHYSFIIMLTKSSLALHMAHYIKRNKPDIEWSICCEKAWFFVRVRNTLDNAIASLWYQKTDGTWRKALGTRNMEFIPEAKRPKEQPMLTLKPMPNYGVITYFDLQKQAWRSFSILQLFSMPDFWRLEF